MNVSIIGTGYVGVVSGACLAASGHRVICVDLNAEVVNQINNGDTPILRSRTGRTFTGDGSERNALRHYGCRRGRSQH